MCMGYTNNSCNQCRQKWVVDDTALAELTGDEVSISFWSYVHTFMWTRPTYVYASSVIHLWCNIMQAGGDRVKQSCRRFAAVAVTERRSFWAGTELSTVGVTKKYCITSTHHHVFLPRALWVQVHFARFSMWLPANYGLQNPYCLTPRCCLLFV